MKKDKTATEKPHDFTQIPEFDAAIRKLAKVPKDEIERREQAAKTPRKRRA
jgi:hypothetical protein